MRPAWSILLFTTLAGLGQGLILGVMGLETFAGDAWPAEAFAHAAWAALALLAAGLVASVFHLGHPERAWRAASQWRTSWLSREVIVLPALMVAVGAHALSLDLLGRGARGPAIHLAIELSSAFAFALCLLLWWCTGMIYGCLRMLREWATPLTPLSFAAIGLASGLGFAAAWFGCALVGLEARYVDVLHAGPLVAVRVASLEAARASVGGLFGAALFATLAAVAIKGSWWWRREALQPVSTLQSALAIDHPRIRQLAMGMTGGSFNTREFFHGAAPWVMSVLPLAMVAFGVVLPLLAFGAAAVWTPRFDAVIAALLWLVVLLQVAGVLCERWLFFAWARHPQNLYYQRIS
jgi:DMSO reductase anchor subunit